MIFDTLPLRQKFAPLWLRQKTALRLFLFILMAVLLPLNMLAQSDAGIKFKGQLSGWGSYSSGAEFPVMVGGRYLPQLNLELPFRAKTESKGIVQADSGAAATGQVPDSDGLNVDSARKFFGIKGLRFDAEVAGNFYGSLEMFGGGELPGSGETVSAGDYRWRGDVKLYRGWVRLSSDKAEIRVGLQKINFGSAMMLRPLMWFDTMDPRDPLQLTDGVWGAMGRYYFGNNANIWVWGLLGNSKLKPFETLPSERWSPEFGGRVQVPVGSGEAAFTFHRRKMDLPLFEDKYENKYGIDVRFDYEIGFWAEAALINKRAPLGIASNQELITLGADYTFGIGNGLNVSAEHMLIASGEKAFEFAATANLSAFSLNYPLGMDDNISLMFYYDWRGENLFNFVRWKHRVSFGDLFVMAFANPEVAENPLLQGSSAGSAVMSGLGIQVMLVLNHQTKSQIR